MKLYHNNAVVKLIGLIRFYIVKIYFFKRLKTHTLGLIGNKNKFFISKKGKVVIGNKFITSNNVTILAYHKINFGRNVFINAYSRIVAMDKITIGDNVTIAQFVSIIDHDHDYKMKENTLCLEGYNKSEITIGNNVWIGDKVTITKGVTIGDNVIIGANSLVVKDVLSNTVVGGNPSKLLKKLI